MNQKEAAHARLRKIVREQRNAITEADHLTFGLTDYAHLIHELLLAWIDRESVNPDVEEV